LKVYNYLSFGISLIFVVMGILILSNVFTTSAFFRNNEFLRLTFGFILIIYGAFRGLNTYFKMKNPGRNNDREYRRY
jgi:cytochrome c biogenesis protein CcdA